MKKLNVMLLNEKAKVPNRANPTDSGLDLYATERIEIEPHSSAIVPTGIAVDLPLGVEAQVRPKSGITSKTGVRVQLGTVDQSYRGEVGVMVDNIYPFKAVIEKGKKIAQLVIVPVLYPAVNVVDSFEGETDRGENGFGSTGLD